MNKNNNLSKLIHLPTVMEMVGRYPRIGDLAVVELMKRQGVSKAATELCLQVGRAIGIFWSPEPNFYSLGRVLVDVD